MHGLCHSSELEVEGSPGRDGFDPSPLHSAVSSPAMTTRGPLTKYTSFVMLRILKETVPNAHPNT